MRWGVEQRQLLDDPAPLVGFIYANANAGFLLVRRDDPLPRRRFTIAHELGHLMLHVGTGGEEGPAGPDAADVTPSGSDATPTPPDELLMADSPETVLETVLDGSDEDPQGGADGAIRGPGPGPPALSLNWQEREANRFAAELLMPEATVRALYDYYSQRFERTARFLGGHIAADLLVSRQAVQYRLADLSLSLSLVPRGEGRGEGRI